VSVLFSAEHGKLLERDFKSLLCLDTMVINVIQNLSDRKSAKFLKVRLWVFF